MRNRLTGVLALVVAASAFGCSSDDTSGAATASAPSNATTGESAPPIEATGTSAVGDPSPSSDASDPGASDAVTVPAIETLPAVGVPGLDSEDLFCRAWSRFGGSFQVVAVSASFAPGDPGEVVALEVVAAPVVDSAYDDLLANWPSELETEREDVAERFLGPFHRRAELAYERLVAAGATDAQVEAVRAAWLDALERRDPEQVEISVDLADDIWAVVDVAAADLSGRIVAIPEDPSLVTDVEVPLTEAYIAANCPDRGTLGGGDVDP